LPYAEPGSEQEDGARPLPGERITGCTVVIVEDEGAVRATLARQVESLGHRAFTAGSAPDALQLLRQHDVADVLISDVVLGPGMDGIDLAREARAMNPRLPVIFLSGYTAAPRALERIQALRAPLLAKPATLSQIERAIDDACRTRVEQPR
jgi:DNA-binding NtrC family response regulator